MAYGDRASANFHVADRPLARADAVEPVALVAGRLVQMHIFFAQGLLDDLPRITAFVAAIDEDLSFRADEGNAVYPFARLVFTAMDYLDPVGIDVFEAPLC